MPITQKLYAADLQTEQCSFKRIYYKEKKMTLIATLITLMTPSDPPAQSPYR